MAGPTACCESDPHAASSRASAWRGGRSRARRWSCAPATASIATSGLSVDRAAAWRSSRRCRTPSTAQTTAALPLTLANGFLQLASSPLNTFAVDPDFRVGSAQNWQASVQRDLPLSLTVIATYLGSNGST